MIHINRADGKHEILTEAQYVEKYGPLPKSIEPSEAAFQLRENRKVNRISIRELAKEIKMLPSKLSGIEHGRDEITPQIKADYLAAVERISLRLPSNRKGDAEQ